ncbi:MAG: MarR family transcriptional regulator [Clostridiales bacterium]|nr:MarR family transcriptional regulator [Clostridiales bacterium]
MKNELISLLDKMFLESYSSYFEKINAFANDNEKVSYREVSLCDLIERHPNCNLSFIAQMQEVSNSAVTQQINSLIKKGYVEKTHLEEDKRNKGLNITPKYKYLIKKANQKIFGKFYDSLTEDEKLALFSILKKARNNTTID